MNEINYLHIEKDQIEQQLYVHLNRTYLFHLDISLTLV